MRWLELKILSNFLRWCLELTFVVGVFVTLFLNVLLKIFFEYNFVGERNEDFFMTCIFTLTPCGVFALVIIRQLISILKSVQKDTPFILKNVRCFYICSFCCFFIALLFTVQMILYPTALTFAVTYVFFILCLACLVFGKLFKKAVYYKTENDLTI